MGSATRYAVVGGAGSMGRITVRDLFETAGPSARIIICDYDGKAAGDFARSFRSKRIAAKRIDVRDHARAVRALKNVDVIVNCTSHHFNLDVMNIALAVGAHYVDLGGLFFVTKQQIKLHHEFRRRGLLAVIGVGASPGITNIMACHAAQDLDSVREIHCRIGSKDSTRYSHVPALPVSYSVKTLLEEFSFRPPVYTRGRLTYVEPMSGAVPHQFGKPVGVRKPMYTIHSEVATLPSSFRSKGVQEVSFKIAFDELLLDRLKFLRDVGLASEKPVPVSGYQIAPVDLTNQVVMAQPKAKVLGRMRQYEIVRTIVKGIRGGKRITKIVDCHTAGMPAWQIGLDINTGSPPSIVAQMIASGEISGKGVFPPEKIVSPQPFFKALKKRRMKIVEKTQPGWKFAT